MDLIEGSKNVLCECNDVKQQIASTTSLCKFVMHVELGLIDKENKPDNRLMTIKCHSVKRLLEIALILSRLRFSDACILPNISNDDGVIYG